MTLRLRVYCVGFRFLGSRVRGFGLVASEVRF